MPLSGTYVPSPWNPIATPVAQYEATGGVEGGAPRHPAWYHNLADGSPVTVQDGPVVHDLVARELDGDEEAAWWVRATEVWSAYDGYQAATDRQIPLVLLEER